MYYTIVNGGLLTAETEQALTNYYDNVQPLPADYEQGKYIVVDNQLVLNEKYEEEKAQAEKERIAHLHFTKREVFLGLYKAKNITPAQIEAQITDPEALIEFQYATEYYRGNPLVDMIGQSLGITAEQLDKFFETNDYTYLLPQKLEEVINE